MGRVWVAVAARLAAAPRHAPAAYSVPVRHMPIPRKPESPTKLYAATIQEADRLEAARIPRKQVHR